MIQNPCALCLKPSNLCKSHIIPDFAYSTIINYDSHPRMVVARDVPTGRVSDLTRQTGYWERLLCQECEGQFSAYEKYASENLFNATIPEPKTANEMLVTLRNLDYATLKLFLLSLLWRVGIATNPFFRCVTLGPHQARLREMLINKNPGHSDEYGCLITPLLPEPDIDVRQLLFQPFRTRTEGHNGCLLCFRGFALNFFISRHALRPGVASSFLNENGSFVMLWSRIGSFQPLRTLWSRNVYAIRREALAEGANTSVGIPST